MNSPEVNAYSNRNKDHKMLAKQTVTNERLLNTSMQQSSLSVRLWALLFKMVA